MTELDLVFSRVVKLPPERIWAAWTDPRLLPLWFCPRPWRATQAEIDLRPGGIFRTVMEGPAGERHATTGCWLEVAPCSRLVWTDALLPGFRPAPEPFVTVALTLDPVEGGTRYVARAMHADAAARDRHAARGFEEGWGRALDQLVEVMR